MPQVNPLSCNRQDLVKLVNAVAERHGWGKVLTTTTVQNLVSAGLPRDESGRNARYSAIDLAAFYARQRKNLEDRIPADARELDSEKKREEIRRLKISNDESEGHLIDAEQIVSEWSIAGQVMNRRMQALVDRLRNQGHDTAASEIESTMGEMYGAVEASIEKHAKQEKVKPTKKPRTVAKGKRK